MRDTDRDEWIRAIGPQFVTSSQALHNFAVLFGEDL
jgi:hypothetical protein